MNTTVFYPSLYGAPTGDGVINHENDDGSHDSNKHAVDVNAADTLSTKHRKQIAPYNSANNTQDDIEDDTFALLVDDFAGDEACNKTENNPADDRHSFLPLLPTSRGNKSLI